jgi:hypothetical protein
MKDRVVGHARKEHRRPDQVDAGDGLEEGERILLLVLQGAQAPLEGLEGAPLDAQAVLVRHDGARGDHRLVHIECHHPVMKGNEIHVPSPLLLR